MPQTSYINVHDDKLWGNDARAQFYNIHFPNKKTHNGHVIFKGQQWKTIRFVRSGTAVHSYAQHMFVRQQNYYTTINTFSGCSCDMEHLYGLTNFYADFDCPELHASGRPLTTQQWTKLCSIYDRIYGMMFTDMYPYDLPLPNTIVCTGRGIGVWWAINQVSYKLLPIYEAVRNRLVNQFAKWLIDCGITEVQLDTTASTRASGLARVPGTYNDTAKRWGFFSILHEQHLDLFSTAMELGIGYIREKAVDNIVTIPRGGMFSALIESNRLEMLYKLRDIRIQHRTLTGHRDQMLYCFYNTIKKLYPNNEEKAFEETCKYNLSFGQYALSDTKVRAYLSSSRKKDYYLTDADTLNRVELTELETAMIGFIPSDCVEVSCMSRRQSAKVKRLEKQTRNEIILSRYQAGESQTSIAHDLGVNKSTVSRIIKASAQNTQAQSTTPEENTIESTNTNTIQTHPVRVAKPSNENIFKHWYTRKQTIEINYSPYIFCEDDFVVLQFDAVDDSS